mmetsp:Transcript_28925/g.54158  ORF Transcript_28925/g.54158 Transcript_28925/m.54158 type:complete len:240 (-) Transcript_28925:365-1084(-)
MLGHVVSHGVGQEHHDALLWSEILLLAELHGGPHRRPCGPPREKAFLTDEAPCHDERFLILRLYPLVHQGSVEHPGDEVVADTLHLVASDFPVERVWLREDGSYGVDADDLHSWNLLFQLACHPSDGSSRSRAHDDVVDFAVRLLQQLLGGGQVVRHWVGGVSVLVEDVRVREFLVQPLGYPDVGIRRVKSGLRGRADDLCAESLQNVHLLLTHLLGKGDDHTVPLDSRGKGKADAGVS